MFLIRVISVLLIRVSSIIEGMDGVPDMGSIQFRNWNCCAIPELELVKLRTLLDQFKDTLLCCRSVFERKVTVY